MTEDTIERELELNAPVDAVWQAITDPRQVSRWFGNETEIDLRPGGAVAFGWADEGRFLGRVEEVDPPQRFSYRWCLDRDTPPEDGPSTLVEFTLSPAGDRTRLRLVESGFASLPADVRATRHAQNTDGWREELGELARYVEGAGVAP